MALPPKTFALALTDAEILEVRQLLDRQGDRAALSRKFHIYPDTALRVKAYECVERMYAGPLDGEFLADYVRDGFGSLRCMSEPDLIQLICDLVEGANAAADLATAVQIAIDSLSKWED